MLEPEEPHVVLNVTTNKGFTEAFSTEAISLMLKLGLIKSDRSTLLEGGRIIVYYVRA